MYNQFSEIFFLSLGYLLGSIPFGKIVSYYYGIDIQKRGSGNIGFANVRRIVGWRAGLITLAADIAKGFVPTLLTYEFINVEFAYFVGLAAIIGHIFPIWLKFNGGKGIATGLGVILVINPISAIVGSLVYVLSCLTIKISSYSSLFGLIATTLIAIFISPSSWWQYLIFILIALWTLRHNISGKVPKYDN